jgi:hypothetical protein
VAAVLGRKREEREGKDASGEGELMSVSGALRIESRLAVQSTYGDGCVGTGRRSVFRSVSAR